MKTKRLLAVFLAAVTVLCIIPFTAFAADPQVEIIDGERTVFLSSFGKLTYLAKSRACFRTVQDALNALGTEGGTIIMTGTADFGNFKDLEGRKPVTIKGIGTKALGNIVSFCGTADAPVTEVHLKGDLILDFVTLKMDNGAFLFTNGYALTTANEFDTFHELKYTSATGITTITYPNPPSIAIGKHAEGTASAYIDAGKFTNIVAGSAAGLTVDGDTYIKVNGGETDNIITGNSGNGTMNGSPKIVIDGAVASKVVAGSSGGTVNGIVVTDIRSGEIGDLVIGAEDNAVINGSVVLSVYGGTISGSITAGTGKVSGKKIIILPADTAQNIPSNVADYIIKISGGHCEPQFDGGNVKGFLLTDIYGIPATTASVNGKTVSSDNGIYTLASGVNEIGITTSVVVSVNKNAHYVAGYADGTFLPQNNMTRAEAITLLTRLITDENTIKGKITANYADVESGAWYESYIGLFQKLGFLEKIEAGYGTQILPAQNITRGEFAELIFNLSNFSDGSASTKLKSFPDVKETNPYAPAINFAVANNIVAGYEDNTFRPDNNITRAEVVTMVNRFLGRIPNGESAATSFTDIDAHWAKTQIYAASGDENVTWTPSSDTGNSYVLSGNKAEDYIKGLYEQSANLKGEAIRAGIDTISEKMKQDILNTPNTAEIYKDKITRDIYYVSEKNGSDDNDGRTPETAFKTIAGLRKMRLAGKGTAILFERGGLYRGTLGVSSGFVYGAYGEGPKPIITQSKKNYADPALWSETQWENVWVCADKLVNVGVMAFDHDIWDYSENCYNEKYGLIMNKDLFGVTGPESLNADLQFYSELNGNVNGSGELYLYYKGGNPGEKFKSIEIGEKYNIVNGDSDDVIIDNISFKFVGGHGMGGAGECKNRTVTNCVFSWIGGSVLSLDFHGTGRVINYGNAVEVYGGVNGYNVENNWMYQIYDTAVTHQRSTSTGDCIQENINYKSNLMEYVYWAVEFYNKPPTAEQLAGKKDNYKRITRNVYIAYNVMRKGGYGWGSIVRNRGCELYSGAQVSETANCLTEYNIIDRAYGQLLVLDSKSKEVDDKNIYIQHIGQPIGQLRGASIKCDYSMAYNIANHWEDKNAVVVVIDPEKEPIVRNIPEGLNFEIK
ncbi:MAG: S-layer homology domain-containing protein [Clostridia bacterium]|nr:S-layer homology domain-containing protein [Clostridia bacterium]